MTFKEFLKEIECGATVEQLSKGFNVECSINFVYEDDDLYMFLKSMGAEVVGYKGNCVLIVADDGLYYAPYREVRNRFNSACGVETIIEFDKVFL